MKEKRKKDNSNTFHFSQKMIQIGPHVERNTFTTNTQRNKIIRMKRGNQGTKNILQVVNDTLGVYFPFFKKKKNEVVPQTKKPQPAKPKVVRRPPILDKEKYPVRPRRNRSVIIRKERVEFVNCLLPVPSKDNINRKLLVLDLDETLVHSSFEFSNNADFIIQLEIDNELKSIYIRKRPFVDEFLEEVSKIFELCVFTAGSKRYADPLLDVLDSKGLIKHRLYRKHCTFEGGYFKKDLSRLGRSMSKLLLVDNSPFCYDLQKRNGMPIQSWYDCPNDRELMELLPWLKRIQKADEVYKILEEFRIEFVGKLEFPRLKRPSTVPALVVKTEKKKEFTFVRRRKRSGRLINPNLELIKV